MKNENLDTHIQIRISTKRKEKWKRKAKKKGFPTLTDLIYSAVENSIDYAQVFKIYDQHFSSDKSVENNLNQLVKWIHINQILGDEQLILLREIIGGYKEKIAERNKRWEDVYKLMKRQMDDDIDSY